MSVLAPAALSLVETQCVEGADVGQALYPFTAQPSEQLALPLTSHEEKQASPNPRHNRDSWAQSLALVSMWEMSV